MTTFSNYALEWEETAITNIGLDFGVLNNRLNGTIEVYDKKRMESYIARRFRNL